MGPWEALATACTTVVDFNRQVQLLRTITADSEKKCKDYMLRAKKLSKALKARKREVPWQYLCREIMCCAEHGHSPDKVLNTMEKWFL